MSTDDDAVACVSEETAPAGDKLARTKRKPPWLMTREERAARRAADRLRRSIVPRRATPPPTAPLLRRALAWCLPWERSEYPGKGRGSMTLLGERVSYRAVSRWSDGTRPLRTWAALIVADYIEARCRAGLDLVAELRAYREPERKPGGFMLVSPEWGGSRRWEVGRGKAKAARPPAEGEGEAEK